MAKTIRKDTRDEITAQCLDEIRHARLYKRDVVREWQKNEDILNDRVAKNQHSAKSLNSTRKDRQTRSHVALHKATGFVQTILSKIDTPLSFKFQAIHEGDQNPAKLLNALLEADSDSGNWDFKDLLGKKYAIIYGRAIYMTYATSDKDGYQSHLELVDPYDFLIDPSAGGLTLQNARYCGAFNLEYDRYELEEGLKAGRFLRNEVNELISGVGNNNENTQEEEDKENRYEYLAHKQKDKEKFDPDLFQFWNWYTTYKGERYYVVLSENSGVAIRIEKLSDITKSDLFPFWSYATFPDASEFWTESFVSIAREVFMAQNVSINQMLDNANKINNPQRAVDVGSILDETELRYKPNGKIRFRNGTDVNSALQVLETPAIDTPLAVYETLENIVQLITGVTGAVQGVAEEEKVGIYEGNISATADRFNLLNKSYANGYKQFAVLWKWGVEEHLKKKTAVRIIGPEGAKIQKINRKDVSPLADYFVSVSASASESQTDLREQREKILMLDKYAQSGVINARNAFEMEAEIVGFNQSDIRRLTDSENTYSSNIISEAARDIENVISGKEVMPNEVADVGYMKYMVDYMRDKEEDLTDKQFESLINYFESVKPIAIRNMVYSVQDELQQSQEVGDLNEVEEPVEEPIDQPLQDMPPEQLVAEEQAQQIVAGEL